MKDRLAKELERDRSIHRATPSGRIELEKTEKAEGGDRVYQSSLTWLKISLATSRDEGTETTGSTENLTQVEEKARLELLEKLKKGRHGSSGQTGG